MVVLHRARFVGLPITENCFFFQVHLGQVDKCEPCFGAVEPVVTWQDVVAIQLKGDFPQSPTNRWFKWSHDKTFADSSPSAYLTGFQSFVESTPITSERLQGMSCAILKCLPWESMWLSVDITVQTATWGGVGGGSSPTILLPLSALISVLMLPSPGAPQAGESWDAKWLYVLKLPCLTT